MRARWVCIPINDLSRILADYAGMIGYPPDAEPVTFMLHPATRKLALIVDAASLAGNQPAEEIKFQLKRIHSV